MEDFKETLKGIFSIVICILLLRGCFVGCEDQSDSRELVLADPYTQQISQMTEVEANALPVTDLAFVKWYADKHGIEIYGWDEYVRLLRQAENIIAASNENSMVFLKQDCNRIIHDCFENKKDSFDFIYACIILSDSWEAFLPLMGNDQNDDEEDEEDVEEDDWFKNRREAYTVLPALLKQHNVQDKNIFKENFIHTIKAKFDSVPFETLLQGLEKHNIEIALYFIWAQDMFNVRIGSLIEECMKSRDIPNEKYMVANYLLSFYYHEFSLENMEKAALSGSVEAVLVLAKEYDDEEEDNYNPELAFKLYLKYAENVKDGDLYNTIGMGYYNGKKVSKDLDKAAMWFKKSAELGDEFGELNYGNMLVWGYGVAKNPSAAVVWYKKSIQQGNIIAKRRLAELYEKGEGVSKNKEMALSLYKEAADAGDETAKKKLEALQNSGCYITTAVCQSFRKPDDCNELQAFRQFRDGWLMHQPDGKALIERYYQTAPQIVSIINTKDNCDELYFNIWQEYLCDCLAFLQSGQYAMCKCLYVLMVDELCIRYFCEMFPTSISASSTKDIQQLAHSMHHLKIECKKIKDIDLSDSTVAGEKELLMERLQHIHAQWDTLLEKHIHS